jgi:DNA-binding NarL/FixJ family response regulator
MTQTCVLAESYPLMIQALEEFFTRLSGCRIVGVVRSGASLLSLVQAQPPHALLLDTQLQERRTPALCRQLARQNPAMGILAFAEEASPQSVKAWFQAGATAYVLKSATPDELEKAVSATLAGRRYIQPILQPSLLDHSLGQPMRPLGDIPLSKREHQVLSLIVEELTTSEIADKLCISHGTVETHRLKIMHKLGVRNTAGMVREAIFRSLYVQGGVG